MSVIQSVTQQKLRDKVLAAIQKDTDIPAFSASAQRLITLTNRSDSGLEEISEVVKLDPGLSSRFIRLSNSAAYGGKSIKSVEDALFRLGLNEVRKVASAVGVMDRVSHLKVKVDWNMFWLHSLLTARLTECLASAYGTVGGKEYLSGLLHDIGKLFLEHNFPQEFESSMLRSMERKCGVYEAEKHLFDITHAEVGWALCEKWNLQKEIGRAVRFHHDPKSPFNKDMVNPETQHLLATCICVADALANLCKANIQGAKSQENIDLETLPEWQLLQVFPAQNELNLDMGSEIQKAQDIISSIHGK